MSVEIKVPISPGELVDKITILEIKSVRMTDPAKLAKACQLLAAASKGCSRASVSEVNRPSTKYTETGRPAPACSTAARMYRTPSTFVRKPSHSSPVIVTAT